MDGILSNAWQLGLLTVMGVFAPYLLRLPRLVWLVAFQSVLLVGLWSNALPFATGVWPPQEVWLWSTALEVSLVLRDDGVANLFGILITGIGSVVALYAAFYFHNYKQYQRFFPAFFIFAAAMLGLVKSDNLFFMLLFWEATTICSFFLIGFDYESEAARKSAMRALFVTGVGGMAFLLGVVICFQVFGTLSLADLISRRDEVAAHPAAVPLFFCLLIAAASKSAQFPFHFWLPGAMAAPSPVSAYLHSATMVKAGIYLLMRFNPIFHESLLWTAVLSALGAVTLIWGLLVALAKDDIKQVLAWTTVSALGSMTLLIGVNNEYSYAALIAVLCAHALYKANLFLGVGCVDHQVGTRDLRALHHLARHMPFTSAALFFGSASMMGLPLGLGFIAKEFFLKSAIYSVSGDIVIGVTVVASSVLGFVNAMRIFRILFGKRPVLESLGPQMGRSVEEASVGLWIGPLLLAALSLYLGYFPQLINEYLLGPILESLTLGLPSVELELWSGFGPALFLSLLSFAIGTAFYWFAHTRPQFGIGVADPGVDHFDAGLKLFLAGVRRLTLALQSGRIRFYIGATIGFILIMCMAAIGPSPGLNPLDSSWLGGRHGLYGPFLWTGMVVAGAGAMAVVFNGGFAWRIVALGLAGYGMAFLYLAASAPDLAMTQVAIESLTVLIFALVARHLPGSYIPSMVKQAP